ncbi:MAG TPA: signal peptide peptidase SppA [Bryobacteraceae bacterium]|jgi:protease-4|nr:signal peptide peptidase SppA [Bryobacteraceae bacterium]
MAKFFIGLVTGVVLVFLSLLLLFAALLRFREKPPQIADNSVLVLRLAGELPEKAPVELPEFLGGGRPGLTVSNVWMSLRMAAADSHIKAVVLEPDGLVAGWAKLEELRGDLEQFRKSGKPVFAYLRTPTTRDYYVALAADRIFTGPEEPLMLKGLRAEMMYFKKTLDKIGVSVDVEHAGKYKDFGDMFTRSDMSSETREVMTGVVDDLYGNLVARIAESRKKSPPEVQAIIDQGPFTAQQALKAGLLDQLSFEDEMWSALKDKLHSGEPIRVSAEKYVKVPPENAGLPGKSRIALVIGEGDIVRGAADDNGADESSLTSNGFDKLLVQVAGDSTIKGVVVRIDSPGGEVTASDDIWRQMNLLSKKKPTVISMSDLAASGGYYMAMTGDAIVAEPGTLTGSIGVVFGKPNLHGLYDKLGITKDSLQRGKHADIDSDYTPLTPEERDLLRQGIDESYRDFLSKVANARHHSVEEIDRVAQGRVWLGSQAKSRGLVDELGGLDTAIDLVKKKANIPVGEQVTLVTYPPRRSIIDVIMKRSQEDMLESRLAQAFGRMPFHAWMKGGYLRLMANWFEVK